MISLKELQFITSWEQKAPYPGDKYAKETLETMISMHEKFNDEYKGKKFNMIFSDSSEIEFEVFDFNLCHLLGINYQNLTNGTFDTFIKDVLGLDRIKSY